MALVNIYTRGLEFQLITIFKLSKIILPKFTLKKSNMATQQTESVLLTEDVISSLNCPVCFEIPSENQIYQCENGHTTCTDCHSKIQNNNCPQCRMIMFKTRFTNFVSNNVLPKYVFTFIHFNFFLEYQYQIMNHDLIQGRIMCK